MADTTAITITAIVTTGIASGVVVIEKRGTDLLDELESSIVSLERSLSRLIVRVGSASSLAATCREVIAVAREIELDLMGVANTMDLATMNDAPSPPSLSEEMGEIFAGIVKLKALRPDFDAAAHEVAGAIIS